MLWQLLNIETKERNDIKNNSATPNIKVLDFKELIRGQLDNVRIDQIVLYNKDGETLKDSKLLSEYFSKNDKIYYRVEEKSVKIIVDTFYEKIDKIVLYLSQSVSVYHIKKLLAEKTNLKLNETMLFYGNKILRDDQIISEEILQNLKDNWTNYKPENSPSTPGLRTLPTTSNSPRTINLKLVKRKGHSNSLSFGLDFSFNYLKTLTKIKFNNDAPDFREVDDGMCLICYCRNPKCPIYKEMFIQNLGYGKFIIFYEAKRVKCKMCNQGNVDVKNLGFVNSEWMYKGHLKSTLSIVQGEGKTFDEKMHTFKETELNTIFLSLEVAVSKQQPKIVVSDMILTSQINETEYDEDDEKCDEDDIDDNVDEFSMQTSRVKVSNFDKCGNNIARHFKK